MTNTTSSAIRAELARRGLSQEKLGEHLGMSQGQVSQRMVGRIEWRLSELKAAAQFLEVPASTLVPDLDHSVPDARITPGARVSYRGKPGTVQPRGADPAAIEVVFDGERVAVVFYVEELGDLQPIAEPTGARP